MPEIDMSRAVAYQPGPRSSTYNILLLVIDDLRADHVSAYGYDRETPLATRCRDTTANNLRRG